MIAVLIDGVQKLLDLPSSPKTADSSNCRPKHCGSLHRGFNKCSLHLVVDSEKDLVMKYCSLANLCASMSIEAELKQIQLHPTMFGQFLADINLAMDPTATVALLNAIIYLQSCFRRVCTFLTYQRKREANIRIQAVATRGRQFRFETSNERIGRINVSVLQAAVRRILTAPFVLRDWNKLSKENVHVSIGSISWPSKATEYNNLRRVMIHAIPFLGIGSMGQPVQPIEYSFQETASPLVWTIEAATLDNVEPSTWERIPITKFPKKNQFQRQ